MAGGGVMKIFVCVALVLGLLVILITWTAMSLILEDRHIKSNFSFFGIIALFSLLILGVIIASWIYDGYRGYLHRKAIDRRVKILHDAKPGQLVKLANIENQKMCNEVLYQCKHLFKSKKYNIKERTLILIKK